jgi:hypothetical protein
MQQLGLGWTGGNIALTHQLPKQAWIGGAGVGGWMGLTTHEHTARETRRMTCVLPSGVWTTQLLLQTICDTVMLSPAQAHGKERTQGGCDHGARGASHGLLIDERMLCSDKHPAQFPAQYMAMAGTAGSEDCSTC